MATSKQTNSLLNHGFLTNSGCSRKTLSTIIDTMDISMWEIDLEFRITSCNQHALATYGDHIVGEHCFTITDDNQYICDNCPALKAFKTKSKAETDKCHRSASGDLIFVRHYANPFFDENDNLLGALIVLIDNTRQKQLERELRKQKDLLEKIVQTKATELTKSRGKFDIAFEASPDAININRLSDGLYVETNKGFSLLTGYGQMDVVGKTSHDIQIWHNPQDREKLVGQLEKRGYCENLEAKFIRKDGTITTGLMSARIIDLNNEPHIISITRDISKLKAIEGQLSAQKLIFENILNSIDECILVASPVGRIQFANRNIHSMFGYAKEEVQDQPLSLLLSDTDSNKYLGKKYGGKVNRYIATYKRKDGSFFPGEHYETQLLSQEHKEVGMLRVIKDISSQVDYEMEREKLISAMEQTNDVIVITDKKGKIEYANQSFEHVTGYSISEVMGKNPRFLKSGKHDRKFYTDLWGTITQGKTFSGQMINRKKDGTEYTEDVTISPIVSEGGEIANYVAVKKDITEKLTILQQLQQAQKMESIGRLTGGVAHDFNNILGIIIGYSELILEDISSSDPHYNSITNILDAANRSAAIVHQLLGFSRQQTVSPKRLDLNQIINKMFSMLTSLIEENIELKFFPRPNLPHIEIDPTQIDQILVNLCVNAKDAITDTGKITIETYQTSLDKKYCDNNVGFREGDYVVLSVTDSGMGMTKEVQKRAFDPFFTTKEVGNGTGLGLSTVYGIIKQNNGFINIYSELGSGTTITIYFPPCEKKVSEQIEQIQTRKKSQGDEIILIVEDDISLQNMLSSVVKELGYIVQSASLPSEAIDIAKRSSENIDLLITDVVMPEMNGRQLSDQLRESNPLLKTLYSSGYTINTISDNGFLKEDINFIQKPFSTTQFAQKIRAILDESPQDT